MARRMTEAQAEAELNAIGEFCRTTDPKSVPAEAVDAMLNRALRAVKVTNKARQIREDAAQRARVNAASGDPAALRKLAAENLAKRRGGR